MAKIDLLHAVRHVLIATNIFGIILAFLTRIFTRMYAEWMTPMLLLFLLSSGMCLWVQIKSKKEQSIQLPFSPNGFAPAPKPHIPRRALIAGVDAVLGTLLLATHGISLYRREVTIHYVTVVAILSLYALFAMGLSAIFHYTLCILYIRARREEAKKNHPKCRLCQQHMQNVAFGEDVGPVEDTDNDKAAGAINLPSEA